MIATIINVGIYTLIYIIQPNEKFQWTRYDELFKIENGQSQLKNDVKSLDKLEDFLIKNYGQNS